MTLESVKPCVISLCVCKCAWCACIPFMSPSNWSPRAREFNSQIFADFFFLLFNTTAPWNLRDTALMSGGSNGWSIRTLKTRGGQEFVSRRSLRTLLHMAAVEVSGVCAKRRTCQPMSNDLVGCWRCRLGKPCLWERMDTWMCGQCWLFPHCNIPCWRHCWYSWKEKAVKMFPIAHPVHVNIKRCLWKLRLLTFNCKMLNRLGLVFLFTSVCFVFIFGSVAARWQNWIETQSYRDRNVTSKRWGILVTSSLLRIIIAYCWRRPVRCLFKETCVTPSAFLKQQFINTPPHR